MSACPETTAGTLMVTPPDRVPMWFQLAILTLGPVSMMTA
jgi:hypothetical protein